MAVALKWLCSCLLLFLVISCSNGTHRTLRDGTYNMYEIIPNSSDHSDIILSTVFSEQNTHSKQHLSREFDSPSLDRSTVRADSDGIQDSGGHACCETENSASVNGMRIQFNSDSNVYYNSILNTSDEKLGRYYWIDMDHHPNARIVNRLRQLHHRTATVKLSFDFPFFGHIVRNVTISTGGFLYTGDIVHSWLDGIQYIAPLMAKFDISLSNESFVKYMDNGTQFTVQWEKVKLHDKPELGSFTFQATLRKNGDITFVYQSVPMVIGNITEDNHPMKIGLSDAYIVDRQIFVRYKTIYVNHRTTFEHLSISNWTVINLIALPTCQQATDCSSCVSMGIGAKCFWCPVTNKCSSGFDRNRQEWIMHKCDNSNINNVSMCPAVKNISEVVKFSTVPSNLPELDVHTGQTVSSLQGTAYSTEIIPNSSNHNLDIILNSVNSVEIIRKKRYLAGEFDTPSWGRSALAPNSDDIHDSGGKVGSGTDNSTSANGTRSNATTGNLTISSVPANPNESKTGGNYVSVHDATTLHPPSQSTPVTNSSASSRNATVANETSPSPKTPVNATIPEKNVTSSNSSSSAASNSSMSNDDIAIGDFFDGKLNLTEHNITKSQEDSHVYYNSTFKANDEKLGRYYWVDMDSHPNTQINDMLSQSHRRAATVKLSFDFPFYGHIVRNVTIATGGFLYTGDYVHSWLAATQYIAPLMANFDTSLSNESFVKYMDNGTQFTVQWEKVKLQDKPESGAFTFQASLRKNGDITFVYQSVPIVISNITDDYHPVKVGLSDAYIIDRHVLFVRRKTIYEYHRITFEHLSISNWTVINLIALPTCHQATDCLSCVSMGIGFDCFWCPETNKCSSGIDRNRQDWIMHECDNSNINNVSMCPPVKNISEVVKSSTAAPNSPEADVHTEQTVTALLSDESTSMSVSALIGILMCIGLLMSLSLWGLYAYRNPHTTSGQLLIKYRPSQWSWRRGEARYTAATIHM